MPIEHFTHRRPPFFISTDPALIDLDTVHGFLTTCYWCSGIPRDVVLHSISGSLCFGVYEESQNGEYSQIGFARVISDLATYGYIADVFVLEPHRGQGLSKWMMQCIMVHPQLQGLRRWGLITRDAHGLYEQFGFTRPAMPDRYMEKVDLDMYKR